MSTQETNEPGCRVENAEKLPPESGGEQALCRAIRNAASVRGVAGYSVEVRVLGPSTLAASIITAAGQRLPEQKYASSDRPLSSGSFERFARVLADQLAEADGR